MSRDCPLPSFTEVHIKVDLVSKFYSHSIGLIDPVEAVLRALLLASIADKISYSFPFNGEMCALSALMAMSCSSP